MWTDNDTDRDFVNFTGVADTVAEIILGTNGAPVSIGVSGEWGVGKSSMIRLIRRSLADKTKPENGDTPPAYLFVEFNAWLYQGYDDARAALMEVIASALSDEADNRKTGLQKAKELLKRINVLRLVRLTAGSAASLALGLPPVGLLGEAWSLIGAGRAGKVEGESLSKAVETGEKLGEELGRLINPKEVESPPREIHAVREAFAEMLKELGITLVVFIDDLDRCLPSTTISTLEAIRLFLFMPRTAFVIAADEAMIKHAVRRHFQNLESEGPVLSYFDKLIQVPVRVPPLGTQEVKAYLIMLAVEHHLPNTTDREKIRAAICSQLAQTWKGQRVDLAFMQGIGVALPAPLVQDIGQAERLAPLLATAPNVKGNPRLIKRFMNALAMRKTIAQRHSVTVNDASLVKMLLFERCADAAAYREIADAVNAHPDGRAEFLAKWEAQLGEGTQPELKGVWDNEFCKDWLTLDPGLGDLDLRGILYLSREHIQVFTPEDRLTSEGRKVLDAILAQPGIAGTLSARIKAQSSNDRIAIMDRLLLLAEREQKWGVPEILKACIAVADADPLAAGKLTAFLQSRPPDQVEASVIPTLATKSWAQATLAEWDKNPAIGQPVKNAIATKRKGR